MPIDPKRADEFKADKDFYLNELRRVETMGLKKPLIDDSYIIEAKSQGNFFDDVEIINLNDFEGF